ncbi:heparan-sulfate 6-O-sulfotransferase 1 [Puma concolor]|uniref:Heparan-sulfate 6-O-sulfotransferase n=1 Tax=Puma concolor TaxID=9696 RepID=A0A6P6I9A0_PUMCO|nr:heparan-sulfate 6-O-sulfotransferase 1 [Puma concolor]
MPPAHLLFPGQPCQGLVTSPGFRPVDILVHPVPQRAPSPTPGGSGTEAKAVAVGQTPCMPTTLLVVAQRERLLPPVGFSEHYQGLAGPVSNSHKKLLFKEGGKKRERFRNCPVNNPNSRDMLRRKGGFSALSVVQVGREMQNRVPLLDKESPPGSRQAGPLHDPPTPYQAWELERAGLSVAPMASRPRPSRTWNFEAPSVQACDCRPGQKKCTCYRPNRRETWLFSRFSTGWSCGLHADWTELTNCVPGVLDRRDPAALRTPRKFFSIATLLRDLVRFLSCWKNPPSGSTWKTSLHMCDGRTPTPEELPPCYEGTDWSGCTLQEFMDCPYNLANNRQVRMLADLSLVGCYNLSFIPEGKRAQLLLESAKKNLRGMAFFGLTEFQRKTQYLFERTFNLKFIRPFMQYNSTRAGGVEVDEDTIRRIEELNDLDVQLYDYAKDLFQQRYQYKRQLERREQRLKSREERLLHRAKEALPREDAEEPGRVPTEDYMSHIIEKW